MPKKPPLSSIEVNVSGDVNGPLNVAGGNIIQITRIPVRREWKRPAEGDPLRRWATAVGRKDELKTLKKCIAGRRTNAVTAAVAGMPGVGKSTLASLFVHAHCEEYPGGVLWAELGFSVRDAEQCQPILKRWGSYAYEGDQQALDRIERTGARIEADPADVRALLDGHGRMLVVIDDIWAMEAAETLMRALPEDARVLATTRDTRIAAHLGAVPLDVLSPEDSLALLRKALPKQPKDILGRLAEGLGGHALALNIAVGDLRAQRGEQRKREAIETLLARVNRGEGFGALPMTDQADRQDKVELALSFSYEDMDEEHRKRLRALGVFAPPQATFSTEATAEVWGDKPKLAANYLDTLAARNLVKDVGGKGGEARWAQHPILRAYALALLKRDNNEMLEIIAHHVNHYCEIARNVREDWQRADREATNIAHAAEWVCSLFGDPIIESLGEPQRPEAYPVSDENLAQVALRMAMATGEYVEDRHVNIGLRWMQAGLAATRLLGDHVREWFLLKELGGMIAEVGLPDRGLAYLEQALVVAKELGDVANICSTLYAISKALYLKGLLSRALEISNDALKLAQEAGDKPGEARILSGIAAIYAKTGRQDESLKCFLRVLEIYEETGSEREIASTLGNIGTLYVSVSQDQDALPYLKRALTMREQLGDLDGTVTTLISLGLACCGIDKIDEARVYFNRAEVICSNLNIPHLTIGVLIGMARLSAHMDNPEMELEQFERALTISRSIGASQFIAQCLANISLLLHNNQHLRRHNEAIPHLEEAVRLMTDQAIAHLDGDLHISLLRRWLDEWKGIESTQPTVFELLASRTIEAMTSQGRRRALWFTAVSGTKTTALERTDSKMSTLCDAILRLLIGDDPAAIQPTLEGEYAACWARIVEGVRKGA